MPPPLPPEDDEEDVLAPTPAAPGWTL